MNHRFSDTRTKSTPGAVFVGDTIFSIFLFVFNSLRRHNWSKETHLRDFASCVCLFFCKQKTNKHTNSVEKHVLNQPPTLWIGTVFVIRGTVFVRQGP